MLPDYAEAEQAIGLDWYGADPNLRFVLDHLLPDPDDRAFAEEHVGAFGPLVGQVIAPRAEVTDKHGPQLHGYDRWGVEVNEVVHHPTWTANKSDLIAAGFVGLPQAYLVCQAETAIYCGLGMTAGAADIVERYAPEEVRAEMLERLTSLDPDQSWEGGMFLSERQGGSDVGANTTVAVPDGDEWVLRGEKHFCSNVDADVFIVLARPEGAPDGSRALATFIVPRHLPDGQANGFRIKRLKPKLGTVGVPTAEVALDGARAWLAGDRPMAGAPQGGREGRGLGRMMEMVNGSRFGVALMGLGIHRRSFLEAAIYASRRRAFGRRIDEHPLVRETLVDLLVDLEANAALAFACAAATRGMASVEEGQRLRRILVPLAKIRATRRALGAASEALEVLGGNGYMEDWPLARQLRDAQCHTIWEGTENILCLDVRRAMLGDRAHDALLARLGSAVDAAAGRPVLGPVVDAVAAGVAEAREAAAYLESAPEEMQLLHARRFADLLADVAASALLLEEATWALDRDGDARKAVVAARYSRRRLRPDRLRGILDDDRTVLDRFVEITRYGRIEVSGA